MFTLFSVVISLVLLVLDRVLGTSFLQLIYVVGVFLPSLGVTIRRLHDTDRSGWWILIGAIPLVGFIILIVFLATEGKPHDNAHGPDPKAVAAF